MSIWSNIFGMSQKEKELQSIVANSAINRINKDIRFIGLPDNRSFRLNRMKKNLLDISITDQRILNEIDGYKELSDTMLSIIVRENSGDLIKQVVKTFDPSPERLISALHQSLDPDSFSRLSMDMHMDSKEILHTSTIGNLLHCIKQKQMSFYIEEFDFDINSIAKQATGKNLKYNGNRIQTNIMIRDALQEFVVFGATQESANINADEALEKIGNCAIKNKLS